MKSFVLRRLLMKYSLSVLMTAAALACTVTVSHAQADLNRLGPYVGLGASAGLSDFTDGARHFGDSAGFNALAGYRWHEYFALEGLYEYMDDFGRRQRLSPVTTVHTDMRTHNFSLMGKAILPLFGAVQPYIKGGVGFLNTDVDQHLRGHLGERVKLRGGSGTEAAGRIDGGIDLVATPHLALEFDAGYVMPTGDSFPLNYISLSLGAQYRF
jgi:opacity protein-like surface antigen